MPVTESRFDRVPSWAWAAGYLAAYILLDWASYFRPVPGLNITPWNPQQALAIALLIRAPRRAWLVFAGLLAAELVVRGVPSQPLTTLAAATALTFTFAAIAHALRRTLDLAFPLARHGELLWLALVVTAGSLASAVLFVLIHFGNMPAGAFPLEAVIRYWVGDAVAVLVLLPVLLLAMAPARRAGLAAVLRSPAWWAGAALTCAALWIVFGRGEQNYFKFFYLLVPPVVWAAVRFGAQGAVLSSLFTQAGLLAAAQIALRHDLTLFELQALMAATAMTGLLLGVAVDERARAEADLRASLRFSAAGQMAAALAHELSQPLTALSNYADACQLLADDPSALDGARREQLAQVLRKLVAEAHRTGAVTRRLRDFFRSGATSLQPTSIATLARETLAAHQEFAQRLGVQLHCDAASGLPALRVDPIQIAVVLRNLLANAIESAAQAGGGGSVLLRVAGSDGGVQVEVTDSGPGVETQRLRALFDAPASGKEGGLGVGLNICRSIVESHGGKLWAEAGPGGRFCFALPRDDPDPAPAVPAV
ncbi:ATP-binding protein [Ramlibacter sp. AN1133]|uniref:ATP-binding protein n=1 Tax=Ramlibacter sp. AN1133 TaxID=3133429 RepID=UPI0030BB42A6